MTQVDAFLQARPALRADIALGDGMYKGAKLVHNLKDRRTGQFFQVGPKEYFLISRLDGERTLADIGGDYAEHFHRRLDEQRWQQLLGILARRRLLVGTDEPGAMAELTDAARKESRGDRTLLKARLPVVDPDRFLTRVEPRLRFLFSPYFVVPAVLAAGVIAALVIANLGELQRQARDLQGNPTATGLMIAVYWLSIAAHETAHGLTCKHFGGSAHEIGVMWRFPILAPYCNANDVVVLGSRWHRFYTAFAGVFTTMVLLIPFGLLWLLAPAGTGMAGFAATLLMFSTFGTVVNLIPLFQLDGYFMLNHALGLQNLRRESYRFLWARIRNGRSALEGYPVRLVRIYTAYGLASVLFGAVCAVVGGYLLFGVLEPLLGTGRALTAVLLAGCAVAGALLIAGWQRRRKAALQLAGRSAVA